ncbi:flagellar type III secretion system protein FlhB [Actibacterium sp. XHP0104]|uniref:flagellar type III secretion system protein FlhB n=1 Tax=Actibacterium sp. XHP0104 TaxID=2984335 RepID=UPI0021E8AD5E|nr:flagellar type III secretion system protein FlhB [Actibacterium sp. XHP0104]MCV2881809.1 flagellar type III secretion system protein FlhB [Actibacterium sp. XHP0104]
MSSESDDKQHEPTQKRLDDARKKGEIPRSTDLNTAASYAGLVLVAATIGGVGLIATSDQMMRFLSDPFSPAEEVFRGAPQTQLGNMTAQLAPPLLAWFLAPAIAVFAVLVAQRGIVFAPEKLQARLSRISPIANAKNKFGASGLFEFAKSAAKLMIFSLVLALFIWRNLPDILSQVHLPTVSGVSAMGQMVVDFLFLILVIALAISAVDVLWQHHQHRQKNRMSHEEMKEEFKQSEGDPHMKQQRRQRGMAIAMNKMLSDVPDAAVVIVNPTHYAVALKWDATSPGAPVCVAKGVDEIAARIREVAIENGVPLHSDPPTARALHATVEIGQEIHRDHYAAVAAAIRFAEAMRKKTYRSG